MEEFQAELAAHLTAVGEKPYVLIGHSWGGVIALEHMRARPPRLRAVVLMSTPLSHASRREFEEECLARGMDSPPGLQESFLSSREISDPDCTAWIGRLFSTANRLHLY